MAAAGVPGAIRPSVSKAHSASAAVSSVAAAAAPSRVAHPLAAIAATVGGSAAAASHTSRIADGQAAAASSGSPAAAAQLAAAAAAAAVAAAGAGSAAQPFAVAMAAAAAPAIPGLRGVDLLQHIQQKQAFHTGVAQLYEENERLKQQLAFKEAAYDALLQIHATQVSSLDQRLVTVKQERLDAQANAHGAGQQSEKMSSQKRKAEEQLAEEAKRHKTTQQQLAKLDHLQQCKICLDQPPNWAACLPCGHLVGCVGCVKECKAKQGVCPLCQADIEDVQTIFFS